MLPRAALVLMYATVVTAQSYFWECQQSNPEANSYCSDYCRTIHPGTVVSGKCAPDEVSCLCETQDKTFIKVKVIQEKDPAPYVETTLPPILVPATEPQPETVTESDLPVVYYPDVGNIQETSISTNAGVVTEPLNEAQELICDGSPGARGICNSFCIDMINAPGGSCDTTYLSCRCFTALPEEATTQRPLYTVTSNAMLTQDPYFTPEVVPVQLNQYASGEYKPIPMYPQWGMGPLPQYYDQYVGGLPPPNLPSFYSSLPFTEGDDASQVTSVPKQQVPQPISEQIGQLKSSELGDGRQLPASGQTDSVTSVKQDSDSSQMNLPLDGAVPRAGEANNEQ